MYANNLILSSFKSYAVITAIIVAIIQVFQEPEHEALIHALMSREQHQS